MPFAFSFNNSFINKIKAINLTWWPWWVN